MTRGVKYCVLRAVYILGLALCATPTGLAQLSDAKTQRAAMQMAKAVLIPNFDSNLPRISLEYFLEYEAGGGSLDWETTACPRAPEPAATAGAPTCVLATILFRDGRMVMVSLAVNNAAGAGAVALRSVMITDENRAVRKLRLIELPAAINRRWRKMPQLDPSPGTLA